MLFNLLSLLLVSFNRAHSLGNCPNLVDDIYFVGNPEDFDYIENCTHLNSSLFVTGDYNIDNLESLSNLESINGYLVILDSHLIRNLKGLHHLQEIKGNELYLKTASVTFKYNNNFMDDENRGLCFTNLVNWTKITPHSMVDNNNGLDCPQECHPECIGCFGPGPRLCQECRHSKVDDTCVNYDCVKNNCSFMEPGKKLSLDIDRISLQDLNVSWPQLSLEESSGVIQSYKLYRNGDLVHYDFFDDSGYTTRSTLTTSWIDRNLTLDLFHFYRIDYETKNAVVSSDVYEYNLYNWNPDTIKHLKVEQYHIINQQFLNTTISFQSTTNRLPYSFIFTLAKEGVLEFQNKFLPFYALNSSNYITLDNLNYKTFYQLQICGYNSDYDILGICSVLDLTTPIPPTSTTTSISTTSRTTTSMTTTSRTSMTSTITSLSTTSISTNTYTTLTTNTVTSSSHTDTSTSSSTTYTWTTISGTTISGTTISRTNTDTTITDTSLTITGTRTSTESTQTTPIINKYTILSTYQDVSTPPKILNIVNDNNISLDKNQTFILNDKGNSFPAWIILLIILAGLCLLVCLLILCGYVNCSNNEVSPETLKPGYQNPMYGQHTVQANEDFKYQNGSIDVKRSANPLYQSGSSLGSFSGEDTPQPPHDYNEMGRPGAIKNPTYDYPEEDNSNKRNILANETYGFPKENPNSVKKQEDSDSNYDYCVNDRPSIDTIRPSSAYRDINRRRNSQEFTVKPSLKNYRPTVRKETRNITDESIGRRKGNLMMELQKSIKGRQHRNFEI